MCLSKWMSTRTNKTLLQIGGEAKWASIGFTTELLNYEFKKRNVTWNIAKGAPVAFCPVCFQRTTSLFLLMSNIRRLITNVRDKEADTMAI